MDSTTLYIKNMVCPRCIKVVQETIEKSGLKVGHIELGKVTLDGNIDQEAKDILSNRLKGEGFELLDDRKQQLIEAVKNIIVELVHYGDLDELKEKFSTVITQKLNKDYHSISKLFSEIEGGTVEQFIIQQKVERVKELIAYGELTLSEISFKMGYSSVAHLSAQFKKVTGMTPSQFKADPGSYRKPIDAI
ncbi:AraC family transcriptional regulator [Chitinophaga caeni]|uniref:AraC family transcriptional regulator n=1 Tax=Chitinophaga caeni TaxID=2029983 RepID=A0A291R083_9BACT|nr:AraC family transcriptional regulator [Chitinophaga caeni]ATL49610.1 AraC family transcriptional regulator [Chitinophaga caeni]